MKSYQEMSKEELLQEKESLKAAKEVEAIESGNEGMNE